MQNKSQKIQRIIKKKYNQTQQFLDLRTIADKYRLTKSVLV